MFSREFADLRFGERSIPALARWLLIMYLVATDSPADDDNRPDATVIPPTVASDPPRAVPVQPPRRVSIPPDSRPHDGPPTIPPVGGPSRFFPPTTYL